MDKLCAVSWFIGSTQQQACVDWRGILTRLAQAAGILKPARHGYSVPMGANNFRINPRQLGVVVPVYGLTIELWLAQRWSP